jgi:hypothetical protein
MKRSSFGYLRVAAAALGCAALWLRGAAPIGAQSTITITSPASGAVLPAGPDYATDALADPWDFDNRDDVAIDPAQIDGFSSFTLGGGHLAGTLSATRAGFLNGSNFYLLQRAYYGILNPGRTGRRVPIPAGIFTKLAFKMTSTRGDQYPRVYWFHNDLGSPLGDGTGWRYTDPSQPMPAGAGIYVVDLTAANNGSPWTAGDVRGLGFYPNSSAVGYSIDLDWVRLTTGDAHPASKILPIAWSGGSGTATIQVRDASGAMVTAATGVSGTSYNWNYGVLAPGTYTITVIRGGVASAARSFRVNTPPSLQITDPDETGGPDFATAVLGNPWDMQDAADVKYDGGATIVDHLVSRSFSNGQFHGISDGVTVAFAGSVPVGDPQVYLFSNPSTGGTTIDTSRYHRLTFSVQVDRGFDLARGSVARVFWGAATGSGAPYVNVAVTRDIITWPGLNGYTVDLATLSGAADGGLEPSNAVPWTSARMRHLRIDPFEFAEQIAFHMGPVKLAADDETTNGSFTIRFAGADADGDATVVALYYDTDTNPTSGLTPIASGIPIGAGQYVWNAGSVPAGTYYIYAVATDGRNGVGRYSTGPLRVSGFVGGVSNPVMSVDTPANGASGPGQFAIAGWAVDLGAASGPGVDAVAVYADPGTAGQTFLGQAAFGFARADVASLYGAQFANSGFALTVPSLGGGTHTIGVYAHSTVSNANTVRTFVYTVNAGAPLMSLDAPANGSVCQQPCLLGGWAIDTAAASGTGVDAIHVYATPSGGAPRLLGAARYGDARADVGAAFGARFTNSGYSMAIRGLAPGTYQIAAYPHSTVTNTFPIVRTTTVTARNTPRMAVDGPANNATVAASGFSVSGWAVDLAAASGPGVDAIHVYAFPAGSSAARLLGAASYGISRPDVGAAFGSTQFNASGYALGVTGLAPGTYDVVVYAHSVVSGAFDNLTVVRVNVR